MTNAHVRELPDVRLGLRENAAQFSLLVGLNALVGAMVGLQRSVLPLVGQRDFHLVSRVAILSFVVAFGVAKALANLGAGALADRAGRKPLIASGMLVQAGAVALLVAGGGAFGPALAAAALLGLGTALVYPTLIVAVSDVVEPRDRASVVGVYRFWRDTGFVLGALLAGSVADALGSGAAIAIVAVLTAASGLWVSATRWTPKRGLA
jgi:predicted MFS family arabinose efflux permease